MRVRNWCCCIMNEAIFQIEQGLKVKATSMSLLLVRYQELRMIMRLVIPIVFAPAL